MELCFHLREQFCVCEGELMEPLVLDLTLQLAIEISVVHSAMKRFGVIIIFVTEHGQVNTFLYLDRQYVECLTYLKAISALNNPYSPLLCLSKQF